MAQPDFHANLCIFGSPKFGSFEQLLLAGEKKVVKLWNRASRE